MTKERSDFRAPRAHQMNVFTMDGIIIFVQLLYDKKTSQIVNGKRINENRKKKIVFMKKNAKNEKNQNLLRRHSISIEKDVTNLPAHQYNRGVAHFGEVTFYKLLD